MLLLIVLVALIVLLLGSSYGPLWPAQPGPYWMSFSHVVLLLLVVLLVVVLVGLF